MRKIIVKEHGSIEVGKMGFEESHLLLLDMYNKKEEVEKIKVGHKIVTFKHYVGIIQVANLTIEILPKIDINIDNDSGHKKLQSVLIDMLKICRIIKTHHNSTANISTKKTPLLEFIYSSFMEEVSDILHIGKIKKYRSICSNVKAYKGRMIFSQNIKHNLVHKERFFTKHQTYDFDNLFNKLLKKALKIISITSSSYSNTSMSKNIMLNFDSVTDITNIPSDIHYNRGNEHYKNAIEMAKLIINSHMPNVMSGKNHTIALLFDMNTLFEEYVYRCLIRTRNRHDSLSNYTIIKQNSLNWIKENTYSLRADIVIENKKEDKRIIIDTKWKVPKDNKATSQDLRQMYVYNMQYGSKHSILLYPDKEKSNNSAELLEFRESILTKDDFRHFCRMEYFKLFDKENEKLNKDAGEDIFNLINKPITEDSNTSS